MFQLSAGFTGRAPDIASALGWCEAEGGCCGWSVVAAIKKRACEGKNAIAALLALPVVKQAIVTDDDINIYNSDEVEWAVTFRCQADKDIVILSGMKGKHVDPSVRPWELKPGELPTTSKFVVAVTPSYSNTVNFIRFRGPDIMCAIANHDTGLRIEIFSLKYKRDEVRFLVVASIGHGTVDPGEEVLNSKSPQYLIGKFVEFRGYQKKPILAMQTLEDLKDPG